MCEEEEDMSHVWRMKSLVQGIEATAVVVVAKTDVISVLIVVVVVTLFGHPLTGQTNHSMTRQVAVDCQQQLMEDMYRCVSEHGVDFNVFITLVSDSREANGTTISSNNKKNICGARHEIMDCVLRTAQKLVNAPYCVSHVDGSKPVVKKNGILKDQRFLIKEQLEAIIGQYDVLCAHPCRISLLDDMRKCYTQYDLDPKLFISTEASGPVIGTTRSEVSQFCTKWKIPTELQKNRHGSSKSSRMDVGSTGDNSSTTGNSQPLFRCLQKSRDDCEESQIVLSTIGLDIEHMSKGVQVLCSDQETYMKSLDCFDTHTRKVEHCQSVKYRSILAIAIKARQENWPEDKYYPEVCRAIFSHIQCDIDAWSAKGDEDCNESTLKLKQKLHCTMIPRKCQNIHNDSLSQTCTTRQKSAGFRVVNNRCFIMAIIVLMQQLL